MFSDCDSEPIIDLVDHDTETAVDGSAAHYLLWVTQAGGLVESSILDIPRRRVGRVYCLPSAVRCPMGCTLCAIPVASQPERLSCAQLLRILRISQQLSVSAMAYQVSFMGQGEPLLNYPYVASFCGRLLGADDHALIGISTVGVAEGIRALAAEPWSGRVKLQISVHAADTATRTRIVPSERYMPVAAALEAARTFSHVSGRRVCLNVTLLRDVNDTAEHARALAELALTGWFYVKVSEFNPFPGSPYARAHEETVRRFIDTLESMGVQVHRFKSIGTNIGVGCGQSRLQNGLHLCQSQWKRCTPTAPSCHRLVPRITLPTRTHPPAARKRSIPLKWPNSGGQFAHRPGIQQA